MKHSLRSRKGQLVKLTLFQFANLSPEWFYFIFFAPVHHLMQCSLNIVFSPSLRHKNIFAATDVLHCKMPLFLSWLFAYSFTPLSSPCCCFWFSVALSQHEMMMRRRSRDSPPPPPPNTRAHNHTHNENTMDNLKTWWDFRAQWKTLDDSGWGGCSASIWLTSFCSVCAQRGREQSTVPWQPH